MMGRMERAGTAFGHHVRHVRRHQRRTIGAVADAIGISREALSKIERGVTPRPDDATLRGLERVLGIPCAYTLEVLGTLPPCAPSTRVESLDRLVALPTLEARLRGWRELPPALKRSLIQLVHEVLAYGIPASDGAATAADAGAADGDTRGHAARGASAAEDAA
jgi:transcriptional regulator with XRE-family HTH domain